MLELALKSAGLLAFVALAASLLRNASAALRHRVWALGFVGLAALPLLALRLPSLDIERPAPAFHAPRVEAKPLIEPKKAPVTTAVPASKVEPVSKVEPAPTVEPGTNPAPSREEAPNPWSRFLATVYGLGVALLLARTAFQILVAARWSRRGEDVPSPDVPPHTRVVRTPAVEVPMTLGFVRPTILLPTDSAAWPAARTRAVLLHEGAHIRRGDWAWLVFARLVTCFYWPNPLVHGAATRMRAEGERAADDMALESGIAPTDYATVLVDLAASLRGRSVGAALPFVEKGSLKARVAAVLSGARRNPLGRRAALAAFLVGTAVVLPFAAARLVGGPLRFRDGRLDLGADGWIEVAAITSIENGQTVSWDVDGARLSQPYLVGKSMRDWMANDPAPSGSTVRYVFLRSKLRGSFYLPGFTDRPDGTVLTSSDYDHTSDYAFDVDDPEGAELRVVRLVVPKGQTRGRMFTRVPVGVAIPYLQADFRKGDKERDTRPIAGLELRPALPDRSWKSEVRVTLPPEFADRQTRLVVAQTVGGDSVSLWDRMSGAQTADLEVPPESIRRIEISTRATQAVVLDGLPLSPRAGASPRPRADVPEGTIEARDGKAQLPDGSWLTLEGVWNAADPKGPGWTADGAPLRLKRPPYWITGEPPLRYPGFRTRYLSVLRKGNDLTSQSWIFDGDGLAAPMQSPAYWLMNGESHIRFGVLAGPERRTMSLLFRTAPTPYRTVAEGTLGRTPGYRGFFRKGMNGARTFAVEFPRRLLDRMQDVDVSLVPLDAEGKEVRNADRGIGSSRTTSGEGENVIEYNLTPDRARLVRGLTLRTRPYAWVRFPDVRLNPR